MKIEDTPPRRTTRAGAKTTQPEPRSLAPARDRRRSEVRARRLPDANLRRPKPSEGPPRVANTRLSVSVETP